MSSLDTLSQSCKLQLRRQKLDMFSKHFSNFFLHDYRGTQILNVILCGSYYRMMRGGLAWAQWALLHFAEALSLRPHPALSLLLQLHTVLQPAIEPVCATTGLFLHLGHTFIDRQKEENTDSTIMSTLWFKLALIPFWLSLDICIFSQKLWILYINQIWEVSCDSFQGLLTDRRWLVLYEVWKHGCNQLNQKHSSIKPTRCCLIRVVVERNESRSLWIIFLSVCRMMLEFHN